MRRGPSGGYNFGNKRQYRRAVWAEFRKFCRAAGFPVRDQHALLIPELRGDEIEAALNAGFRQQNLHIVNDTPAVVAVLKRKYPLVNTYGVDIVVAAKRIARKGVKLRVANLDLCSQLSFRHTDAVDGFVQSGCPSRDAVVAVTVLRGREQKDVSAGLDKLSGSGAALKSKCHAAAVGPLMDKDWQRLAAIGHTLRGDLRDGRTRARSIAALARAEIYRSDAGVQTMLFGVFYLTTKADAVWIINPNIERELQAIGA